MGGSDLDMTQTDKRFHVALFNDNTVRFLDYKEGNDFISISFKEYKDAVDCRDALMYQCDLMNELDNENKELKSFIKSLCDKNNEIWLDDGSIYRLRKVFKGEWVK